MLAKLGVPVAVLLVSASEVFAGAAGLPVRHAPEIDGGGALAVFALVMSLGAILYAKVRK